MDSDGDQRLSVELLMGQLVEQASLIMASQERLRRLLAASRSIVRELPCQRCCTALSTRREMPRCSAISI